MRGLIPENILDNILSRINIAELISDYIPLKRAGRNFKALCPFHQEKTASFMVSPYRQIYHCFGCGKSGNAFKFLMDYERIDFKEAVEILAKKCGVILPKDTGRDYKSEGIITQLYRINEAAASFYEKNLNSTSGSVAMNYLLGRKLKKDTIKLFKLGFAQDKWETLISYLRMKNFSLSLIEGAGLVVQKTGGGYYDRFRNRIIFPIFDIKSRVVGFGARVLDSSLPKYINSPETQIYIKGRNLYGLNFAKDSIKDEDSVVVVEGYLDLITPYQEGLKNIVASLGTALTLEQVRLLKRYTHNAVMVYDADIAGELATLRTLDIFIEEDMKVKVVSLPTGTDPDSFVRTQGIQALREKIKSAQGLFDFKLRVLKSRYDSKNIEDKARIAFSMLETINKFRNAVLKSEYIRKLADDLDIKEDSLLHEVRKIGKNMSFAKYEHRIEKKALNIKPTEKLLLKLMLEERELIETIKEHLKPSDFLDERLGRLVSTMFDLIEQGKAIEPSILMNYYNDEDISEILCESIFLPDLSEHNKERVINDCINRLKNEKMKLRSQYLCEQIKVAQDSKDEEKLQTLIKEFHCLAKERHPIKSKH